MLEVALAGGEGGVQVLLEGMMNLPTLGWRLELLLSRRKEEKLSSSIGVEKVDVATNIELEVIAGSTDMQLLLREKKGLSWLR